jgi:hypothetical protein
MNSEHSKQCSHIDHTIGEQVQILAQKIDHNTKITENVIQQVSGIGSDLKAFKIEMLPVQDGLRTIQSLNKFIKWLGLPAIGALISYWLLK